MSVSIYDLPEEMRDIADASVITVQRLRLNMEKNKDFDYILSAIHKLGFPEKLEALIMKYIITMSKKGHELYYFLSGRGINSDGKSISDIWEYSMKELEDKHNYIQWLFPTKEPSKYNPNVPVIKNLKEYQTKNIRNHLLYSFLIMLDFFGLQKQKHKIVYADNFMERKKVWLAPNNHNYLRITRILQSLVLFGMQNEAIQFLDCLCNIYEDYPDCITKENLQFWKNALK